MSSFRWPVSGGSGGGVNVYSTISVFPALASDGALGVAADTHILYVFSTGSNTWSVLSTPGSDLVSLNSDTTANQTITVGTSGTDVAVVDNGTGDHKINIPVASATNTGKLSNTDWSTFNNKQPALGFTAVPNTRTVNGHALSSDVTVTAADAGAVPTTTTVNGQALSGNVSLALDDMSDVTASTPITGDGLQWNGTAWVNSAPAVGAGFGVVQFLTSTASDIGGYATLATAPLTSAEVDTNVAVTVGSSPVLLKAFATSSTGLLITSIPAGLWEFDVFANESAGTTCAVKIDVYSRTSGGVETLLFTATTPNLSATVTQLQISSVQPAFSVATTDRLVFKYSATNSSATSRTVHIYYDGTTHNSHTHTPLTITHNSLSGNQGGSASERYHLSAANATDVVNATDVNNVSTLVKRDGSGKFAIGTINFAALDANTVPFTNGSLDLQSSETTTTELGYLHGVTSELQTQLDAKIPSSLPDAKGDILTATADNTPARKAVGTYGKVLMPQPSDATGIDWMRYDNNGINYIAYSDAENNATTGYATYADAAGASPVDATGGSPTTTWTTTSTNPLRGTNSFLLTKDAANRQGEGVSYAFTIDAADQARSLTIEADYTVVSGTYATGDVTAWIYDVTNSVLIQPAPYQIESVVAGTMARIKMEFQTPSNSTSYRLAFHVSTTSASAYVLKFDNIQVGPRAKVFGAPVTDWQSYTPTISAWSANTTTTGKWRRVGDSMELSFNIALSGAPTGALSTISLPAGYSLDPAKMGNTTYDYSSLLTIRRTGNTTYSGMLVAGTNSSTTLLLYYLDASATAGAINATTPATFGNGDTITGTIRVPILGWSSSLALSDSADTRVVSAIIGGDPASATSGNPIIVPTVSYDSHGAYNASTGRYTCAVPGQYVMTGAGQSASSATTLTIYKNAVSTQLAGNLDSNGEATFSGMVNCVAGDIIDLRPGGTVDFTNATLNIFKLSGPSQIAASESVAARYYASATSLSGSLATIVWSTKDYDTHGAMSSGVFTCPVAGKYHIASAIALAGTFILNNTSIIEIQKNGVAVSNLTRYIAAALTNDGIDIEDTISCLAGDTLRIQVSNSGTTPSIVSSNTRNYVSIVRIGL